MAADDDIKKEKREKKSAIRMDLEGWSGFVRPRPLIEPRPFGTDKRGRPVAMAADAAVPKEAIRTEPFVLEEPKSK